MSDDLARVVEQIGRVADQAEASRWKLCKEIADAYEELPAYERGLTAGLCVRLRRSSDSIYNYRNAEILRKLLHVSETLPPSHFWTLFRLREKYEISDDDCREWLNLAVENNLSVRDMSQEIEAAHVKSQRAAFLRHVKRLEKLAERIWEDAESAGLPDDLRPVAKAVYDGAKKLAEWTPSD